MTSGARNTDAVGHLRVRGNIRGAVKMVRVREPERLRWRSAVSSLTEAAGTLYGTDRMRVEEPIREVVLDLTDPILRREVELDPRLHKVDLDRSEILPRWTFDDLRRLTYIAQTDLAHIERYVPLPRQLEAPVDTAAIILVGRAYARLHRRRAQDLWLRIPDADGPGEQKRHHRYMAQRAARHRCILGILRVLHHGDAVRLLDRQQARRTVVEVARQDDADSAGTVGLRCRPKQGVDRGPRPVLPRAARQEGVSVLNDEMQIGRREVDVPLLQPLAGLHMSGRHSSCAG